MTEIIDEDKFVIDLNILSGLSQDAAIWGLEAMAEQYTNYDEKGRPRLPIGLNRRWLQVLGYAKEKIYQAAALKEENERLGDEVKQLKEVAKERIGRWRLAEYDARQDWTFCLCDSCQSITYVPGQVPAQYCSTCGVLMENGGER